MIENGVEVARRTASANILIVCPRAHKARRQTVGTTEMSERSLEDKYGQEKAMLRQVGPGRVRSSQTGHLRNKRLPLTEGLELLDGHDNISDGMMLSEFNDTVATFLCRHDNKAKCSRPDSSIPPFR